jgi:hypothetical protein
MNTAPSEETQSKYHFTSLKSAKGALIAVSRDRDHAAIA